MIGSAFNRSSNGTIKIAPTRTPIPNAAMPMAGLALTEIEEALNQHHGVGHDQGDDQCHRHVKRNHPLSP